MRRLAPLSWWKLAGALLVLAGLLQHPAGSHPGIGSPGGVDAEFVAGSEAVESLVLALQHDGVRVVRPVRPVERSVEPQPAGIDWLLRFDRGPLPKAATFGPNRRRVHRASPGLVGVIELRI